ncbi:hypothetical protein Droror1_Dr00011839 [Drosera rotundifolia]
MDMACIESLPWFTFITFYDQSFPIFAAANVSSYEWSFSNGAWPSPSVPTLHLPGSNLQSSCLKASLSARDWFGMLSDFDLRQLLLDDMKGFPHPRPNLPSMGQSIWSKTLMPSNLDD